MKKTCLILTILMFLMTSCSFEDFINSFDDSIIADNTFEKIIDSVKQKDAAQLTALFSKTAHDESADLEADAEKFIEFIEGDIVSFSGSREGGVSAYGKTDHGKTLKIIQPTTIIETSEQKYHVAMKECTIDEFNSDNVGVMSIYIIKDEDWKETCVYRGDAKWELGINIADE